jgi:hypothetical protein
MDDPIDCSRIEFCEIQTPLEVQKKKNYLTFTNKMYIHYVLFKIHEFGICANY